MAKPMTATQTRVYTHVLTKFKEGQPLPYQAIADKLNLSRETVRRAVISVKLIKRNKLGSIVGVK